MRRNRAINNFRGDKITSTQPHHADEARSHCLGRIIADVVISPRTAGTIRSRRRDAFHILERRLATSARNAIILNIIESLSKRNDFAI